jgi:hypothetical protein
MAGWDSTAGCLEKVIQRLKVMLCIAQSSPACSDHGSHALTNHDAPTERAVPTTQDAPTDAELSPFLRLPGELRNKIYRLVLLQPDQQRLEVAVTGINEPGLLLANHKIRDEAAPIFYGENRFQIRFLNYHPAPILKWTNKCRKVYWKYNKLFPECSGLTWFGTRVPNWRDLLLWLEHWHGNKVYEGFGVPVGGVQTSADIRLIPVMFQMVDADRDKPWDKVREYLEEAFRPAMGDFDKRWLED